MTIRATMLAAAGVVVLAGSAAAQTGTPPQTIPGLDSFSLRPSQQPSPTPLPTAAPAPVPTPTDRPNIVVPTAAPRDRPTPRPTATPSPRPEPTAPAPRPTPTASASPRPATTPTPSSSPTSQAADIAPAVAPTPTGEPVPESLPTAPAGPATDVSAQEPSWFWLAGVLLAIVAVGGVMWALRRRSRPPRPAVEPAPAFDRDPLANEREGGDEAKARPTPEATQPLSATPSGHAPPAATTPVGDSEQRSPLARGIPIARAAAPEMGEPSTLVFELITRRAGTNLTGAAVDYAVRLRNDGDQPAQGVRLELKMLSASVQQDAQLRAIFARPVEKPVVAPFDLPPGADMEVTGMALAPLGSMNALTMEGRPYFVPVLAMQARYSLEGVDDERQATAAFMIGIERGGAKMAPFALDGGPRMFKDVGQRRHVMTPG